MRRMKAIGSVNQLLWTLLVAWAFVAVLPAEAGSPPLPTETQVTPTETVTPTVSSPTAITVRSTQAFARPAQGPSLLTAATLAPLLLLGVSMVLFTLGWRERRSKRRQEVSRFRQK